MKKKLAIVAHNINNRGGMEIHLSEMIMRLSKDYEITVIASELSGSFLDVKFIKIPVPQRPVFLKSIFFAIMASLVLFFKKFDFVHTTGAIVFNRVDMSTIHFCHRAYRSLGLNDRLKHTKSFAHKINSWLQGNFALWMEGICYQPDHIPHLVVVSEHVKKEVLEHFYYKENDISIIYNGVDVSTFTPATIEEKTHYKNNLGIPEDALVFIFVGGDWARKGLRILLEAFQQLLWRNTGLKAKVLVVGKGDKQAILKGFPKNVTDHVIFHGFKENPSDLYRLSDIYVLPSLYETFSIASLEAGACGLPVIMTSVGIANVIAEDNITGYTVDRNKESVLEAMEKLALNPELREKMSFQVRLRALNITWDETHKLFQKQYESLIDVS
ncbi:glycosyltransferase family 4 protein [Bacillus sp. MB2021]|uniref:glycosyltransferase family 4 protein n=1 Tax=Bacillus sp. MB2021 TaxID=1408303 RepID=UPI0004E2418F|nr:glycosyltransferase family 4 protein [Bacillus sp. MB2021]